MPDSIDEYLAGVSSEAQAALGHIRGLIHQEIPFAEECITYGLPTFKHAGRSLCLGAFKHHCTVFAGHHVAEFAAELGGYKTTRGGIQFTRSHPLPDDLLRRIIRARLSDRS